MIQKSRGHHTENVSISLLWSSFFIFWWVEI